MSKGLIRQISDWVLVAVCGLFFVSAAAAQPTNGTVTLTQDTLSSGGGQVGGGNPVSIQTAVGLPASGRVTNGTFTVFGGIASVGSGRWLAPVTTTIDVIGTVNDPQASVTVNGIVATVAQDLTFLAANVPLVLGPNTLEGIAIDRVNNASLPQSIQVWLDVPATLKTSRGSLPVRVRANEPLQSLDVNGVPAICDPQTWECAASVPVVLGYNRLTATATDQVGNSHAVSIGVFLMPPRRPPARPTVGTVGTPPPEVTTDTSVTFGGTKTNGTSIWINGAEVVALNEETIWSVTLTNLVEGNNILVIIAKDAAGVASAPATINIIVDNLPPEIRNVTYRDPDGNVLNFDPVTSLPKTNVGSVMVRGEVDDSKTSVVINGETARRTARNFEATVPIVLGANTISIAATSPNNHPSASSGMVSRGTIPSRITVNPASGDQVYAGIVATIQSTAADAEGDALEYQVLLTNGQVLGNWSANSIVPWTPAEAQRGPQVLEIRVRDGFGGEAISAVDIFVGRAHVQPVSP